MNIEELREQLEASLAELALAERAMEAALDALQTRPRAEKVTVTEVVLEAFARVRTARERLCAIRDRPSLSPDETSATAHS